MRLLTLKKVYEIEVGADTSLTQRQKKFLQGIGSLRGYGILPSDAPITGSRRRGKRKAEIKD